MELAIILLIVCMILFFVLYARHLANLRERDAERLHQQEYERQHRLDWKQREEEYHRAFVAEQRRLMSDSIRYNVLRRDGFRCQICGATAKDGVKLHVDHIRPVSKGGRTEMSNLRTLCERCNMGKGAKLE